MSALVRRLTKRVSKKQKITAGVIATAMGITLGFSPLAWSSSTSSVTPNGTHDTQTVTLLTGDRVTIAQDGSYPTVAPAAGRDDITFHISKAHEDYYVIPSDASILFNNGSLDKRLFNITHLVSHGYADDERTDIPLITQTTSKAARTTGASLTADLSDLGLIATSQPKTRTHLLWESLTSTHATTLTDDITRVWLDGKRELLLDTSVPQIGAPDAWHAGYTGEGVTIGVLDSGIDANHPDVAEAIIASKDFSGSGDTNDDVGHGTHVASIIAGDGAASDGQYRGVAPDANLLIGKVCGNTSCDESAILAGMLWAAQEGATAINMSLGGYDTPDIDPLEQAVEDLTAEHGTLFVIAAGNDYDNFTIGSPGSADSALTVGAVDKNDDLAVFSSRGPRNTDSAIKPDITAPGVNIVAARASGTTMGEPVGDHYQTSSGTSMASPHVTGAVALLAQQHPEWTSGQLKTHLMNAATPNPEYTAYDQGAGRIDIAQATSQSVYATPASISAGIAQAPHDDNEPIVTTVTYINGTDAAVTLDVNMSTHGPEGTAAPVDMFTIDADTVTIPASGSAELDVTVDTSMDTENGLYTAHIAATNSNTTISIPVAVDRQEALHELSIQQQNGDPDEAAGTIIGLDNDYMDGFYLKDGTTTVQLPEGSYYLDFFGEIEGADTMMVHTRVEMTQDRTVTFDQATTGVVNINVPDPAVKSFMASIMFDYYGQDQLGAGSGTLTNDINGYRIGQTSDGDLNGASATSFDTAWQYPNGQSNPDSGGIVPVFYRTSHYIEGDLPSGFTANTDKDDYAKIQNTYNSIIPGSQNVRNYVSIHNGIRKAGIAFPVDSEYSNDYLLITDGLAWVVQAEQAIDIDGWPEPVFRESAVNSYEANKIYNMVWAMPAFTSNTNPHDQESSRRNGDHMEINVPMFTGSTPGYTGWILTDSAKTLIYADGELIAETEYQGSAETDISPGATEFRVEASIEQSVSPISTSISSVWTFTADTDGALALTSVSYQPGLGNDIYGDAGETLTIPFTVFSEADKDIATVEVDVSFDEGQTWMAVSATGGAFTLDHPADATSVSLRSAATDVDGNTAETTIINAYLLK